MELRAFRTCGHKKAAFQLCKAEGRMEGESLTLLAVVVGNPVSRRQVSSVRGPLQPSLFGRGGQQGYFPWENPEVSKMAINRRWVRSVHVCAYTRFRLGRFENVCQHWRSHPGQLSLFD